GEGKEKASVAFQGDDARVLTSGEGKEKASVAFQGDDARVLTSGEGKEKASVAFQGDDARVLTSDKEKEKVSVAFQGDDARVLTSGEGKEKASVAFQGDDARVLTSGEGKEKASVAFQGDDARVLTSGEGKEKASVAFQGDDARVLTSDKEKENVSVASQGDDARVLTSDEGDAGLDAAPRQEDGSFNLQSIQRIVDELKKEQEAARGSTTDEPQQKTEEITEGAEARETEQKVKDFVYSEGVDMESYVSGSQGSYMQKALKKFYDPQSLLEPSGLKAYFEFHIGIIEDTSKWLSHRSRYYRSSIEPTVLRGLALARVFAASLEVVLAEALTEIENLERLRYQKADREAFERARKNRKLGMFVLRLRELSWMLDAVFGEVSGTTRAYRCPQVCVTIRCRWTCEMKKTLPAEVDSLVALTTRLASIFETIQAFIDADAYIGCLPGAGKSPTFEHREAEATLARHAHNLSSNVGEFQRLLKGTGGKLMQLRERMLDFASLFKPGH
ncbi:hypothetical protein TGGT1_215220, partial [Toxoplasma gondii GT1]